MAIEHIYSAAIEKAAGVDFNIIPFDGSGPAAAAMVGGHIDGIMNIQLSEVINFVESGLAILLATLGQERDNSYADLPTVSECGVDVVGSGFASLITQKGVPIERIEWLSDVFGKMMQDVSYLAIAANMKVEPGYMPREEAVKFVKAYGETYIKGVKAILADQK